MVGFLVLCLITACADETPTPRGSPKEIAGDSSKQARPESKKEWRKRMARNSRVFGADIGADTEHPTPAGRWGVRREDRVTAPLAPWQRRQLDQLEAMGYVQGSQQATQVSGITRYNRQKAQQGLNLYISGHEPSAMLMDMEGRILHRWHYPFKKAWKPYPGPVEKIHTLFWRYVHLYENGDLLAIFEGLGMIKIDRDSNLIWKSALRQHHDLEVTYTGDIFVLTRQRTHIPSIHRNKPIIEDFITIMSADGQEKSRISLIEALESNRELMPYWDRIAKNRGDIFHTNALEILDGSIAHKHSAFAEGNILVSMAALDALFVIDPINEEAVWGYAEEFRAQHDPKILPNGNLLLFDNKGASDSKERSRILEYSLPHMNIVWRYQGPPEEPFYTCTCGIVQRLANGNTLITETDNGRAFEIEPNGEIVWEFVSPHRTGPDNTLVASLFELKRISRGFVSWLVQN